MLRLTGFGGLLGFSFSKFFSKDLSVKKPMREQSRFSPAHKTLRIGCVDS
jgi:hypothetical protein